MSFWKRKKQSFDQASSAGDTGQVQKARKGVKRSPPLAMEVKILALEALDSGLSAIEVGELVRRGLRHDPQVEEGLRRRRRARAVPQGVVDRHP